MSQIDTIYSTFDQLTTWEQYRDLLIGTLTASGYPNLDTTIRSEFDENHFDNPELLTQFIVPLFSPHSEVANRLYSGTDPLNLLVRIDRSRELVVNGAFNTDLEGWVDASDEGFETTWEDGLAQLNGGGPGATSRLRQGFTSLEAGRYVASHTGAAFSAFGATPGASTYSDYAAGTARVVVIPTTGAVWLNFATTSVQTVDNVSFRRID